MLEKFLKVLEFYYTVSVRTLSPPNNKEEYNACNQDVTVVYDSLLQQAVEDEMRAQCCNVLRVSSEKARFSLRGSRNRDRRFRIYRFLLENFTDAQRFNITTKISQTVLGNSCTLEQQTALFSLGC